MSAPQLTDEAREFNAGTGEDVRRSAEQHKSRFVSAGLETEDETKLVLHGPMPVADAERQEAAPAWQQDDADPFPQLRAVEVGRAGLGENRPAGGRQEDGVDDVITGQAAIELDYGSEEMDAS